MSQTKVAVDGDALPVRLAAATKIHVFLLSLHAVTKCMAVELIVSMPQCSGLRFIEVPTTMEQPKPYFTVQQAAAAAVKMLPTEGDAVSAPAFADFQDQRQKSDSTGPPEEDRLRAAEALNNSGRTAAVTGGPGTGLAAAGPRKPVIAVNIGEEGARIAFIDVMQAERTTYNPRNPNFFSDCKPEEVVRAIRYPEM
jgi:hypothetical protein